jgi:hypothetical protein
LGHARATDQALVDYENLPHDESSRILQTLLKRKVRLHFLYTAGRRESFNHRGQLRAMFPGIDFADLVQLDYLPGVDHTQIREADRRTLIAAIVARLAEAHASGVTPNANAVTRNAEGEKRVGHAQRERGDAERGRRDASRL